MVCLYDFLSFLFYTSFFWDQSIRLELFVRRSGRLTSPEDGNAWRTTFVEEAGRGIKMAREGNRNSENANSRERDIHRPRV